MPASQPFDPAFVLDQVGGDTDLLRDITDIFLSEYPQMVSEIRSAIGSGNAEALEHSAHTLKGCVSNFGARSAVEAARELELMGRRRDLAEAPQALRALELHFNVLLPALAALRDNAG